MAVFETWLKCDLKEPVAVQKLSSTVFAQDELGNLIGVSVTDGGEPVQLFGSVVGSIIRADGVTVTVEGEIEDNTAFIVLPDSAYDIVGEIQISIRLIDGSEKTTLAACIGYVHRTATNAIIDDLALYNVAILPDLPTANGTYTLKVTINNGVATYAWTN